MKSQSHFLNLFNWPLIFVLALSVFIDGAFVKVLYDLFTAQWFSLIVSLLLFVLSISLFTSLLTIDGLINEIDYESK